MSDQDEAYEAPEVSNMVIKSTDAKMYGWKQIKGKDAKPAVEAVAGKSAIAAMTDEDGNETSPAQPGVKAVKAQDAVEAKIGCQHVHVQAKTMEILDECIARLAALGFHFADTAAPADTEHGVGMWITIGPEKEDMTALRQAFKQVKGKEHFNAPGLAIIKEEKKKAAAEAKAKKDAEKAAEGSGENEEAEGDE